MKEALRKSYEGGYRPDKLNRTFEWKEDMSGATEEYQVDWKHAVLDPEFWRCLGVAMGWRDRKYSARFVGATYPDEPRMIEQLKWKAEWHRFIDWLSDGKSPDDFFKVLLANK